MLGHDVTAALPELRAHAESRMVTTWLVQAGPTTGYSSALQREVTTYAVEFTTKGRLRVRSAFSQHSQQAGGGSVVEVTRELHIPVSSPLVPQGALVTCIEIDGTSDPALLNSRLTVEGPIEADQTTARRLKVTELASATPAGGA